MDMVHDKIDKIFKEVGEFGPYQLVMVQYLYIENLVPRKSSYQYFVL